MDPRLLPAGQVAMPWQPAQLDLAGTPLLPPLGRAAATEEPVEEPDGLSAAIARTVRSVDRILRNEAAAQLPLELPPVGPQLELRQWTRAQRWYLRDELRPHAEAIGRSRKTGELVNRIERCGRVRVSERVELVMRDGTAFWRGLHRCGSVWACPVCSGVICAERAEEIRKLVSWHGPDRVWMGSFTVRHALGDDAKEMFDGVSNAWRRFIRGAPWRRFARRLGLRGMVRAFETTIGPNGWHPHLHVLFLVDHAAKPEVVDGDADPVLDDAWEWMIGRWMECVRRELGAAHVPDRAHGVDLRTCRVADYITKLGLEIAGLGKEGRGSESRTPWQLALDVVDFARERDAWLWRNYQRATHGRRQLTWSRGLRRAAGLEEERGDDALVDEEETTEAALVYVLDAETWDRLRNVRGASTALLNAAEKAGPAGVREELRATFARTRAPP